MKYSIKKQIACIFIGLMAGTILLCWFINSTFLEKYYVSSRIKVILSAYEQINLAIENGNITSEEFDVTLQRIGNRYDISMVILDGDSQTIKIIGSETDTLEKSLKDNFFKGNVTGDIMIDKNQNYIVQNTIDEKTQTEFIEMWGVLSNGNLFLIRTALENIRYSVEIANRFLMYVGMVAVFLGSVVIYYISKKVTEPILELARISKRMTNLDFDAKYNGESHNEIALLGDHINQLSDTLKKTISELKTANNELQRDIDKKNQIDEMRKEFLSNVSHELKTPIALIQGYAEGLMEGIYDDEESKNFYCEVICDEAAKMNTMVKSLLNLNELEFGNNNANLELINIVDLLVNTIQSMEILLMQNQITLIMEQYEPIPIWGDYYKIEEVFRNYMSNAIHHASGAKEIKVTLIQAERTIRISVFNTGESIPQECVPYLWDKFYKIDKARTREYGGSGVGLSIVKASMESLNQKYGVQNYQNGVEFWFELESGTCPDQEKVVK